MLSTMRRKLSPVAYALGDSTASGISARRSTSCCCSASSRPARKRARSSALATSLSSRWRLSARGSSTSRYSPPAAPQLTTPASATCDWARWRVSDWGPSSGRPRSGAIRRGAHQVVKGLRGSGRGAPGVAALGGAPLLGLLLQVGVQLAQRLAVAVVDDLRREDAAHRAAGRGDRAGSGSGRGGPRERGRGRSSRAWRAAAEAR